MGLSSSLKDQRVHGVVLALLFAVSLFLVGRPTFLSEQSYGYLLNGTGLAHSLAMQAISPLGAMDAITAISIAGLLLSICSLAYVGHSCLGKPEGPISRLAAFFLPIYLLTTFSFFQAFMPGQFDGSAFGLALAALSFALFWKGRSDSSLHFVILGALAALAANFLAPLPLLLPFYLLVLLLYRFYPTGDVQQRKPSPVAEASVLVAMALAFYLMPVPLGAFDPSSLLSALMANKFVFAFSAISISYIIYKGELEGNSALVASGAAAVLLSAVNPVLLVLALPLAMDGFKRLLSAEGPSQVFFMLVTLSVIAISGYAVAALSWAIILAFLALYATTVYPLISETARRHYPSLLFLCSVLAVSGVFMHQLASSGLTQDYVAVFGAAKALDPSPSVAVFSYPNAFRYFTGLNPANATSAASWLVSTSSGMEGLQADAMVLDLTTLDSSLAGRNLSTYVQVFRLASVDSGVARLVSRRGDALYRQTESGRYALANALEIDASGARFNVLYTDLVPFSNVTLAPGEAVLFIKDKDTNLAKLLTNRANATEIYSNAAAKVYWLSNN